MFSLAYLCISNLCLSFLSVFKLPSASLSRFHSLPFLSHYLLIILSFFSPAVVLNMNGWDASWWAIKKKKKKKSNKLAGWWIPSTPAKSAFPFPDQLIWPCEGENELFHWELSTTFSKCSITANNSALASGLLSTLLRRITNKLLCVQNFYAIKIYFGF